MNRLVGCALVLVIGSQGVVGAQMLPGHLDICQVACFHDKVQSAEYSALYSKIKDSPRYIQGLQQASTTRRFT